MGRRGGPRSAVPFTVNHRLKFIFCAGINQLNRYLLLSISWYSYFNVVFARGITDGDISRLSLYLLIRF